MTTATRKPSAVASRMRLAQARGHVERWSAIVVLAAGVVGTLAATHGGWRPLLTLHLHLWAVVLGLGCQAALTFVEWAYRDRPLVAWSARVIDATLTAVGFAPLLVAPMARAAVAWEWVAVQETATALMWGVLWLVSLFVAWYPESRLVD